MSLVKSNNLVEIPNNLPITNKDRELYLANKNFPKIRDFSDKNEVVKAIHNYISATIFDYGVNMEIDEQKHLKMRVTDDIMRNFPTYSLEEIRLAFYYGVRGELGEFYGMNPNSFYGWLKKFREDMIPSINKQIQVLLPKPVEHVPTQIELDENNIKIICDVYYQFIETGKYDFYDINNIIYKFLDRIKVIDLSNEQKFELVTKSRNLFKNTIYNRNKNLSERGKDFQKIDLDRAYKQIDEENNPTFENQIRIGAMRLALFEFVQKCVVNKVDLDEFIREKLNRYHKNRQLKNAISNFIQNIMLDKENLCDFIQSQFEEYYTDEELRVVLFDSISTYMEETPDLGEFKINELKDFLKDENGEVL